MSGTNGLLAITKLDGVKDLPMRVRAPFAKALLAEQNGNSDEASKFLDEAVEAEATA